MHRKLALTAVLAVALAVPGYAQKKDFSGTWTMDAEASAAANPAPPAGGAPGGGGGGGGMRGGGGGGPMTIKHTGDTIAIERAGRGGGAPVTTTYKLDGSEQEVAMGQMTAKVKAKWDGANIVIETTRAGQDGAPMTTTAVYSLDDKGQLVVDNKSAMGSRKAIYKKTT